MERRVFLGSLAAATVLPRLKLVSLDPLYRTRIAKVGIQLYTVRDLMKADFEGTLAKVAQTGYREVEFAGYFDHTPQQVRAVLDKNGLVAPSCHVGWENTADDKWAATLETVKAVGHQYVVCAWIPEESRGKTADDWKRIGDRFNKAGQAAQAAGVQFAYHNHNFEFVPLADKQVPYDLLLAGTDPKLVQLEIDLFWITFAGADPVAYFMKNLGRVPMVHVKDMIKKPTPDAKPEQVMVDVGKGSIDWKAIFAHSGHAGIQHYFVEYDNPPQPLADIKTCFDYLSTLDF